MRGALRTEGVCVLTVRYDRMLPAEIALFVHDRRVSAWRPIVCGRVRILIGEHIHAYAVRFMARIPMEPPIFELFVPVDAYIHSDLNPGDTVELHDLQFDVGGPHVSGFETVDDETPDPDEDYDEEPFSDVRPDEETQ
jgi:hypothetical protein